MSVHAGSQRRGFQFNVRPPDIAAAIVLLGAPFVVAFLGSQFTTPNVDSDWYRALDKPAWQPPSWLFGPVWSALYLLMGIAAFLVWLTRDRLLLPMALWAGQLGLNLAWSYVFFEARELDGGVAVIVALLAAIIATTAVFATRSRTAALLMLPYIAWVTFATSINVAIALGN